MDGGRYRYWRFVLLLVTSSGLSRSTAESSYVDLHVDLPVPI